MGYFATGITVVTMFHPDGSVYGVTVNSFTSVSLQPLLVLICLDNRLPATSILKPGSFFGVSILREEQEEVSRYFARRGGDRHEARFDTGSVTGVPLVADTLARLECEVAEAYPGGDHTIYLGSVQGVEIAMEDSAKPLIFFRSRYTKLA